jgi:hypothetical protein
MEQRLALYPFSVVKNQAGSLLVTVVPVLFILVATMLANGRTGLPEVLSASDSYFGGEISLSATDLTGFDKLGANGLIPIMRLGGATKVTRFQDLAFAYPAKEFLRFWLVSATIFLGYLTFAMISRLVFELKQAKADAWSCFRGLNVATVALSLLGTFVVMFLTSFALQGFQLVLLLNFGIFFALAIPLAAAGDGIGGSLFGALDFFRFNLSGMVQMYLLCMGAAIAAPIGLLIVFMFPLSVLDQSATVVAKLALSLFGITFALFYQYAVCARAVYDFSRKTEIHIPSYTKIGKKIR